jgi:hypothetical protein
MGRGAHYPPGAGCGVAKGILIVWHACSFLASSILFKLMNVFHTDSVLLRNLSSMFRLSPVLRNATLPPSLPAKKSAHHGSQRMPRMKILSSIEQEA